VLHAERHLEGGGDVNGIGAVRGLIQLGLDVPPSFLGSVFLWQAVCGMA
jgi:hypothetical protein